MVGKKKKRTFPKRSDMDSDGQDISERKSDVCKDVQCLQESRSPQSCSPKNEEMQKSNRETWGKK
eukprot:6482207-Amphidinium_carterae.1